MHTNVSIVPRHSLPSPSLNNGKPPPLAERSSVTDLRIYVPEHLARSASIPPKPSHPGLQEQPIVSQQHRLGKALPLRPLPLPLPHHRQYRRRL